MDGLTGIANRRTFDHAIDLEWRRSLRTGMPLSLLLADVDFFKKFNDHYGHQAGDDCLRSVASALSSAVRRPGDIVARYGGEEFVVILPTCDGDAAMDLAELMRQTISNLNIPHAQSDIASIITISVGLASTTLTSGSNFVIPPDQLDRQTHAKDLVMMADRALYDAKRQGRNRVSCATACK